MLFWKKNNMQWIVNMCARANKHGLSTFTLKI